MGVKMVIGKGSWRPKLLEAFQKYGAVYAHTPAGGGLLRSQHPEIQAVHWLTWACRRGLGPESEASGALIVAWTPTQEYFR